MRHTIAVCELLIFTQDRSHDDVYLDAKLLKRGAVIAVNPDGWKWGAEELSSPVFRVIRLPGIDETVGRSFMGAEQPITPPQPFEKDVLLLHQFVFDLDHPMLPDRIKDYLADDKRTVPTITVNLKIDQLTALKKKRKSFIDPALIGDTPTVIG